MSIETALGPRCCHLPPKWEVIWQLPGPGSLAEPRHRSEEGCEGDVAIEKQITDLGTALAALSQGASKLGKSAKSGLKGLFTKGKKLGTDFSKYAKTLGF